MTVAVDDIVLNALMKPYESCRISAYAYDYMRIFLGILLRLDKILYRYGIALEHLSALLKEGRDQTLDYLIACPRAVKIPHC